MNAEKTASTKTPIAHALGAAATQECVGMECPPDQSTLGTGEGPLTVINDLKVAEQSGTTETLPEPENRVKNAFRAIRDLPYRASAHVMAYTTPIAGDGRTKVVKESNAEAQKRRNMIMYGVGALAVANVGWNIFKAAKGFNTSFHASEFIMDQPKGPKTLLHALDASDVLDTALDFSREGAEVTTEALLNNRPKPRRAPKPKVTAENTAEDPSAQSPAITKAPKAIAAAQ